MRFLTVLAVLAVAAIVLPSAQAAPAAGNRLTYLDAADPFYPDVTFARLITPQWVADSNVEAVVVLAIDDMREPSKYEAFLRPILNRLQQLDAMAGLSIMTVDVDPNAPQLQAWLKENVSLEVHTLAHPCPLLARSNFLAAARTYHEGVARLFSVPGNEPVAFRMPCCDSINSPSPRFYSEIFNQTNGLGQFLQLDSSVMNIFTSGDSVLPRAVTMDEDGQEKFHKYLPFPSFVTTIENYPYPYVIGRTCWEFPAVAPSDWEAQHLQGTNNPATVRDWKAALDATVLKKGVFNLIFHPHGWIRNTQVVEFINYAAERYGRRVKFLNFHQAAEQLRTNLLSGQSLRDARGDDNGVRLLDLDGDGYMDVIIANDTVRKTRRWVPDQRRWAEAAFPISLVRREAAGRARAEPVHFGILNPDGQASCLAVRDGVIGWHFREGQWVEDPLLGRGLGLVNRAGEGPAVPRDLGLRLRDLDRDGICELILSNPRQNAVFAWTTAGPEKFWKQLDYGLPQGTSIVTADGLDNGVRFFDLNDDGYDDLLFANSAAYSVHLFVPKVDPYLGWKVGWSDLVASGASGDPRALPGFVRPGEHPDNGAWVHGKSLWWQNEETASLPDHVDRRSFADVLRLGNPPPNSPAESLKAIRVHPGFKVELVAAEPLVMDPVAFDWDASGRLWVVEMGDYPLGLDGHGQPGGIVRFLQDTNADGLYDRSTVFLDHVNFPNGIIPWKKGVIVSAAPEIFYAEDTNGDGKADIRRTLFTGFNEGNQQHRLNGFELGLDNWLYGANGDSNGEVQPAAGGPKVNISGRDFRFKPDEGLFEAISGQTQFGRHRDDWGNWFGNNNPNLLWHYYLPEHYLKRNPFLAAPQNKEFLAKYDDGNLVFPASKPMARFNFPEMVNRVTSANSATPYRDELFGPEFARAVFISEPVHNLVHLELLEPRGVTFRSHRHPEETRSEFLASADNWFRPTMLKTGPDGALYIADMYRLVLEHPQWIPPEMQKRFDLRAGADQGRIYRVYPENATLRPVPPLDDLDVPRLVQALDSPNGWQRDTVQRLLLEKKPASANLLLKRLVLGANYRPQTRLQALATLAGIVQPEEDLLVRALSDPDPAVRAFAVQLSEQLFGQSAQKLKAALLRLVSDKSIIVRYQLAFTLGSWNDRRAGQALAELMKSDFSDPALRTALLSSAPAHSGVVLETLLADPDPSREAIGNLTQFAAAEGNDVALEKLFTRFTPTSDPVPRWQFSALNGFLDGLERRGQTWNRSQDQRSMKARAAAIEATFAAARRALDRLAQPAPSGEQTEEAIGLVQLISRDPSAREENAGRLQKLLQPQWPIPIQRSAARALLRLDSRALAAATVRGWPDYSPNLQTELLNLVIGDQGGVIRLLEAIERSEMPASAIGPVHRQRLLRHNNREIQRRAEKLFAQAGTNKATLIASYQQAATLRGDPVRGQVLFRENCASCHRFKGEGTEVGPPLETVRDKPTSVWLAAILDPNQAFEARYANYLARLKSNREVGGIIVSESANNITLRAPGGGDEVILRADLKELQNSGRSLMPEGLEVPLPPQAMADLLEFLRAP